MLKLFLTLMMVCFPALAAQASAVSKNKRGNKAFKKGKYPEAVEHYQAAQVEAPEKKAIAYNLGNAHYKANDFEKALSAYDRAKGVKDSKVKKKALFNAGNAYYRAGANPQDRGAQEKLKQAVEKYKEVLKLDPFDQNAKFNLQKALERLEQIKKQQQQQKDNKDNQDKKDDKNKQDQKNQQDKKDQKDQKQKQDQQDRKQDQNQKDQKQEKEDQKQARPKPKPGEMGEEEAKRLLDALRQDEKDLQKKRLMMMLPRGKLEKDW
jgi:tetratricopeptide (TPR) repeat protein